MLFEQIVYFTVSLSLLSHLLYVRSIIKGRTKPNLVSWFLWMLAPFIGVYFQFKAGAGLSMLPIFIDGLGSLIIIIAAVLSKNGFWRITAFDIYCGLLSLLALVFYIFTHNLGISIFFAILSDALAAAPTLAKSWNFPETENAAPYVLPILANSAGLLVIKNWIFSIYSFGVYFVIINTAIVFCIYRKRIFRAKIIA
jgi:hypothetical protein